jgi:hypothetical protein
MALLALALLIQAVGVATLRHWLGKAWLHHPVALLYLASVLYQGVTAILLAVPPIGQWDSLRDGIAPSWLDDAALLTSAAMLALVIAYLPTQPRRPAVRLGHAPSLPDWRLFALVCLPLAALTYEGKGYNDGVRLSASTGVTTDLASTFFVITVIAAALAFCQRHGIRWFLPVLAAQSLFLAAAGERSPVLAAAAALAVALTRSGIRPSRMQVHAAIVLTTVAVLAITVSRAETGRTAYHADTGFAARAQITVGGITDLAGASAAEQGTPGLLAQAAARLDGTSFAAGILQAESMGYPRISATYIPESLLNDVPRFIWPSKLDHTLGEDPALLETDDFGLQQVNFLPGLPGLFTGMLPWPWLILLMATFGFCAGWAERWLLRKTTPARLVMLAGAIIAALDFEQGLPGMLLALRATAAVTVTVWVFERVHRPSSDETDVLPGMTPVRSGY